MMMELAYNLPTGQSSAHMYYIPVYVQLVLLTPAIGRALSSRWRPVLWVASPLSVLLFIYLPLLTGQSLPNVWAVLWNESCLGWIGFFALGMFLGNGLKEPHFQKRYTVALYFLSLLLQMAEGCCLFRLGVHDCGSQLKLSALLTSTLFCLLAWSFINDGEPAATTPVAKACANLGDCSFGIYLCHPVFILIAWHFFPPSTTGQFGACAAFVMTLAASWLFVFFGGRLAGSRLSKVVGFR